MVSCSFTIVLVQPNLSQGEEARLPSQHNIIAGAIGPAVGLVDPTADTAGLSPPPPNPPPPTLYLLLLLTALFLCMFSQLMLLLYILTAEAAFLYPNS